MSSVEEAIAEETADAAEPAAEDHYEQTPRQAVVIVHGMGEQRPMETLRGFVKAVWSTDTTLTAGSFGRTTADPDDPGRTINKSWIKPDTRAQSYELRRITTPNDASHRRTDFYELYWADITEGTTVGRLRAWVKGLLLRWPSDVPRDALKLYVVAWLVTIVILAPAAASLWMKLFDSKDFFVPAWAWSILGAVGAAFVAGFLVPYFGDVAAYVQAEPDTIGKRKAVRERGLQLLGGLMDSPAYDRIVLVAHSLGSIIAYDLLQILWDEYGPSINNPRQEPDVVATLRAVGKYALPMDRTARAGRRLEAGELAEFRRLQWRVYSLLRSAPAGMKPWKISDFVTCGSPLTHAEFLVTRNAADFARSVEERLVATCPPVSETKAPKVTFKAAGCEYPHHAAVFAATRWTNICDRGNGWLTGDPISGSLLENFGPGVENVGVRMRWALGHIFTHTQYWSLKAKGDEVLPSGEIGQRSHFDVLRDAVDLRRSLEASPAARSSLA